MTNKINWKINRLIEIEIILFSVFRSVQIGALCSEKSVSLLMFIEMVAI